METKKTAVPKLVCDNQFHDIEAGNLLRVMCIPCKGCIVLVHSGRTPISTLFLPDVGLYDIGGTLQLCADNTCPTING